MTQVEDARFCLLQVVNTYFLGIGVYLEITVRICEIVMLVITDIYLAVWIEQRTNEDQPHTAQSVKAHV